MKEFFLMGQPFFMAILSLLLLAEISWITYHFIAFRQSQGINIEETLRKLKYGRSIGLFAIITGILGQLLGFYQAFGAIAEAGDISPTLVYQGLQASMATTLYGLAIYLIALLLWFTFSQITEKVR